MREVVRRKLRPEDARRNNLALVLRAIYEDSQLSRADLAKMLVHRRARQRGLGAALLAAADAEARRHGKTLLVLDTASAEAERLYQRAGWQRAGTIPGYALLPQGGLCATTFFYRALA